MEAQPFSVKRAQVEFHNFASLGEPETNLRIYAEENTRRGTVIRKHAAFIGSMTPFLEIGANAGHTSYMLANQFGAEGFAPALCTTSLQRLKGSMHARQPVKQAASWAHWDWVQPEPKQGPP